MSRPRLEAQTETRMRLGLIHLSFSLGSPEAVDAMAAALLGDGYAVVDGPRVTGDGYYECQALGPEGNVLEFTV